MTKILDIYYEYLEENCCIYQVYDAAEAEKSAGTGAMKTRRGFLRRNKRNDHTFVYSKNYSLLFLDRPGKSCYSLGISKKKSDGRIFP